MYGHLRHAWLYDILIHYLINGTIFGKVTEHKIRAVIIFTNFTLSISHSKKNSARYCTNVERLHVNLGSWVA